MEQLENEQQFLEFKRGDTVFLFTADWCPDCKAMDMWIDPIVDKYNDYKWYSVNRDELEDVASDNEVMGIPSLLIFENGQKQAHLHSANAKSPEQVESFLKETFNK